MGREILKNKMLLGLNIKNFAIIDDLQVEFGGGLNILSGETGAGKSIVVGAVNLVLGGKAYTEYIRTGEKQAVIEGRFHLENGSDELRNKLSNIGIDLEENEELIIRRIINKSGSKAYINDCQVNISNLESIGKGLIDMHGQHEHQSLLYTERHIDLLDAYGKLTELRGKFSIKYSKWLELERLKKELTQREEEKEKRCDFLQFQLDEIKKADLKIGEDQDLENERRVLINAEKLHRMANQIYERIYQNENSVLAELGQSSLELKEITSIDESLKTLENDLSSAYAQIEEISYQTRDYLEKMEFNPERLEEIENRIDIINKIKRKYRSTIAETFEYQGELEAELENISHTAEKVDILCKEINSVKEEISKLSCELSKKRRQLAHKIEQEVTKELKILGMDKTQFSILIQHQEGSQNNNNGFVKFDGKICCLNSKGIDQVEFLISPNVGEELKPLAKIASGGELSRIMLALKTILSNVDNISTLVFDEIDVGIGGRIADVVGRKLKSISSSKQVLCITHLPQIAGLADNHYHVSKGIKGERTKVSVKKLDFEERIQEIARMLGGQSITEIAIKHAREMVGQGGEVKK